MKKCKLYRVSLIVALLMTFSQHASAQLFDFYSSPGYSSYISSLIDNHIWKSSMDAYTKNYRGRSTTTSRPASSRPAAPPQIPAYRRRPAVEFKSTGTQLTVQEYIDAVNIGPREKAELKQLVLGILKNYETAAVAKGYPNDWALAFVSYVGLNSHVYNGLKEKPIIPFGQNIGVRDIVADSATEKGIFNNVTDRQKQELYELLIIMSGLTYHFYEKALKENDVAELAALKESAADNLRRVGVKP